MANQTMANALLLAMPFFQEPTDINGNSWTPVDPTSFSDFFETSIYTNLRLWAIPIGIIALIFCGIKLMSASDPRQVGITKTWIVSIICGLGLFQFAPLIVKTIHTVAVNSHGDGVSMVTTIAGYVQGLVVPVGIIAVILCGFFWITASDEHTAQMAKRWLLRIAIGILIALLASTLVRSIYQDAANIVVTK